MSTPSPRPSAYKGQGVRLPAEVQHLAGGPMRVTLSLMAHNCHKSSVNAAMMPLKVLWVFSEATYIKNRAWNRATSQWRTEKKEQFCRHLCHVHQSSRCMCSWWRAELGFLMSPSAQTPTNSSTETHWILRIFFFLQITYYFVSLGLCLQYTFPDKEKNSLRNTENPGVKVTTFILETHFTPSYSQSICFPDLLSPLMSAIT